MSKGEREIYIARAISVGVTAQNETDPELREILEGMATSYRALVDEADQVAHLQRLEP